ncbi:hypothetical protein GUJ93_ZPchr0014g46795 [Zizania palustris]|uniref:Uncharacterized protein n=1 Tax=Zizania palustris TaxID=103762 RepID=A0A8J5T8E3_ZIZPA|nr:hypothetical protein GUJ93_ZPchr0014g46795 [Zizania palustris]
MHKSLCPAASTWFSQSPHDEISLPGGASAGRCRRSSRLSLAASDDDSGGGGIIPTNLGRELRELISKAGSFLGTARQAGADGWHTAVAAADDASSAREGVVVVAEEHDVGADYDYEAGEEEVPPRTASPPTCAGRRRCCAERGATGSSSPEAVYTCAEQGSMALSGFSLSLTIDRRDPVERALN